MLWAARKLGRPVRWACERREALLADEHARDTVSDAELALESGGRFIGLRVRTIANVGAYVSSDRNLLATFMNVSTLVGVYTIPAAYFHVTCVLANVSSTAPYRGAGRPKSTYVIERLVDDAARELGCDRVELRRTNLIPASAMPYRTALRATYDSGRFEQSMEYAIPRADTLPEIVIGSNPVPTALNPLGAKGAGEAGTVGALPAVMNAVVDALVPVGVRHLDMPATPERVWRAIQEATRSSGTWRVAPDRPARRLHPLGFGRRRSVAVARGAEPAFLDKVEGGHISCGRNWFFSSSPGRLVRR